MYYRDYQKQVYEQNYRKSQDVVHEQIGTYIKKQRLAQGLKQIVVCNDICSVSHYSRIENNKITPTREQLEHILKRLNHNMPDALKYRGVYQDDTIREAITAYVERDLDKLIQLSEQQQAVDQNHQYYLMKLLESIFKNDKEKSKEWMRILYGFKHLFSKLELETLLYLKGKYYFIGHDYKQAQSFLELALDLTNDRSPLYGLIYYTLAKTASRQNKRIHAFDYILRCKPYFEQHCEYAYIIKVKLFIEMELLTLHPKQTINNLKKMMRLEEIKQQRHLFLFCQFLIAKAYKVLKQYDKSYSLFKEVHSSSMNHILFHKEYMDLLLLLNKKAEAKTLLQQITNTNCQRSKYQATYYYLYIDNKSDAEKIETIETILIPYAEKRCDVHLDWSWRNELIELLTKKHRYQEANHHYQILLKRINY